VDEEGRIKLRIEPIEGTYEPELGGVGSLGAGKGSWFVVAIAAKFASEMVVSYDGKTGKEMWRRDFYGPTRERRQSSCCISQQQQSTWMAMAPTICSPIQKTTTVSSV